MKSVGKQLEAARLGRNWTPEATAKITKIRIEQLLDLERDDFTRFPSPAYARGFVRLYAKALGLDDRRMLAQLDGRLDMEDDSEYVPAASVEYIPQRTEITAPIRVNRFGVKIILVLLGAFATLFLMTLFLGHKSGVLDQSQEPAKEEPVSTNNAEPEAPRAAPAKETAPVAKPEKAEVRVPKAKPPEKDDVPMAKPATPADLARAAQAAIAESTPPPAAVPAKPVSNHKLVLQANRTSWLRVINADTDKVLFEGVLEGGQSKAFEATEFTVKIAVPSAVDIVLDGYNNGPYNNESTPETFTIP